MLKYLLIPLIAFAPLAEARPPDGGGALPVPEEAASRAPYEQALRRAYSRSQKIHAERGPQLQVDAAPPILQWPVREAITVTAPTVQAISNFVDQDPASGALLDFDCGQRTYDGHNGTDIFIAPYSWLKMEQDEGIVIAAADGTIVDRREDQPERSCSSTDPDSDNNYLIVEHADGSLALYAHMRTDSLTRKPVGATVEAGEYLGVIGSSGYSTGPHLHFEVGRWEQDGDALYWQHRDPYAGQCNVLNEQTWWQDQPAYHQSRLQDIATHDAEPLTPDCPGTESPHYQDVFAKGQRIYVAAYYRDQLQGQQSQYTLRRPDGTVYYQWNHASDHEHFASSWWYWYFDMPASVPSGKWTFTVSFQGDTLTHSFWIDAQPEPRPLMPTANNDYNGLWYDPALDGEGYNFITFGLGTVIYFYGSDARGRRLWLQSDVMFDAFKAGETVTVDMFESSGGVFEAPMKSNRGLSRWGTLQLEFSACDQAVALLQGQDGNKTSQLVKLAGVTGTGCVGGASADAPLSGLWYDPALDGEGYNVVVTPWGLVVFYYGFDVDGVPLWMMGGPFAQTLETGQQYQFEMFKATSGTFAAPTRSNDALESWGTLTLDILSCTQMTMSLDVREGSKISDAVQLVGVVGLACP